MTTLEMMDSILQYRKDNNAFQRSIDERSEQMQFRFFDGPPFASWDPHYGHLLAWAIKDVFPRYMTMRSFRVERKWWWDCHGLPVEKAVEKNLWIDGKRDIENKIWIKAFTEECRKYVDNTNEVWKWFVDHSGRWADIEHPYRTMDLDFMESVMYCFSNIYRQNLVYKWFKVQRYCPSCATPLANNEVTDGYEDKVDNAITIKFPLSWKLDDKYEHSEDWFIDIVCGVIRNAEWKAALLHYAKSDIRAFPGWKVDKWETLEQALERELQEEVWITISESKHLGWLKIFHQGMPCRVHRFEVKTSDELVNKEQEKHDRIERVKEENADNSLWFILNIDGTIIDDEQELLKQFADFYFFISVLNLEDKWLLEWKFSFLAWTTTPWTLPSNMFLAMWADIDYVTVYDPDSQEYFVMAESLLKKYYRSPDQYKLIYRQKWKEFQWVHYTPLFDYIQKSEIQSEFKSQFFQVLLADYVSTEDGTGIVHIAPTFGQEDFEVVADFLWADKALDWLFIAVNEYGEFDHQVPDYEWQSVLAVNKEIIDRLKAERKLIKSESITHSYPHCWRCHTPLISKAMSSRFIKEQQMNAQTIADAEKIRFVPESVSNRFVNWLKQAPDWNIARNRYWGSPLPIWANVDDPLDTFSLSTLDEMYQLSRSWSKNLTKFLFIRHGRTDYNLTRKQDSRGDLAHLCDEWKQQAENIKSELQYLKSESDKILLLSPMERTRETALPTMQYRFTESEIFEIRAKYDEFQAKFREIRDKNEIIQYLQNPENETLYELWHGVWWDFRATEFLQISIQWKESEIWAHEKIPTSQPLFPGDECVDDIIKRTWIMIRYLAEKFATKTVVVVSHGDPIWCMRSAFRPLVYVRDKAKYYPKNGTIKTHYRDNDTNTEVDLHKPYVDSYRWIKDGKTYKRIPEVMDCWFESWAMPFGQDHYIGQKEKENQSYTAEFIAEWLDQTRWWFRSLHILNHAIKWNNAANNIIVNGLVLAEDGKKMSKSLKNFPDPRGLIEQWWWDAYRIYVLSAPVVRAEPMRFSEKWVEQSFKDYILPLQNVYNFFETYAKIDQWKSDWNQIFALRNDTEISESDKDLVEKLVRTNPDIILTSDDGSKAEEIKTLINKYTPKAKEIEVQKSDFSDYFNVIKWFEAKRVLILASDEQINSIWNTISWKLDKSLEKWAILPLISYQITNDLDAWLLSELHQTLIKEDELLQKYALDDAIKTTLEFLDKLTNWWLRRSRRRFWANGMDADKNAAYSTLYTVLKTYLQMLAPFIPFVTENLWQKLADFSPEKVDSIHLTYWPASSELYISPDLMEEIAQVRKIIRLALFVRAKNKVAIKQPLQKLSVKME